MGTYAAQNAPDMLTVYLRFYSATARYTIARQKITINRHQFSDVSLARTVPIVNIHLRYDLT